MAKTDVFYAVFPPTDHQGRAELEVRVLGTSFDGKPDSYTTLLTATWSLDEREEIAGNEWYGVRLTVAGRPGSKDLLEGCKLARRVSGDENGHWAMSPEEFVAALPTAREKSVYVVYDQRIGDYVPLEDLTDLAATRWNVIGEEDGAEVKLFYVLAADEETAREKAREELLNRIGNARPDMVAHHSEVFVKWVGNGQVVRQYVPVDATEVDTTPVEELFLPARPSDRAAYKDEVEAARAAQAEAAANEKEVEAEEVESEG